MKLIDIDPLKKRINKEVKEGKVYLDSESVIDIVRCKECKWYKNFDGCFFDNAKVEENDYCSYGEREDE